MQNQQYKWYKVDGHGYGSGTYRRAADAIRVVARRMLRRYEPYQLGTISAAENLRLIGGDSRDAVRRTDISGGPAAIVRNLVVTERDSWDDDGYDDLP